MRLKVVLISVFLAAVLLVIVLLSPLRMTIGRGWQESGPGPVRMDAFRFPPEEVLNEVEHGAYDSIRFIFLYVEASDFTGQNLNTLFTKLAAEYQDTQFLQITAFSDKEMLQRAVDRFHLFCGVVSEDKLPARSGYFYAQYSRRDDSEFFDYTPDPDKPDTARVWFRPPPRRD